MVVRTADVMMVVMAHTDPHTVMMVMMAQLDRDLGRLHIARFCVTPYIVGL